MKRLLILFTMAACIVGCLSAQETLDSLSYAMGDYFTRLVMHVYDCTDRYLQTQADREAFLRGLEDELSIYSQDPVALKSYSEGQIEGILFLMTPNNVEESDMNCIACGLRKVADGTFQLPQDTIGYQLLEEGWPGLSAEDECRYETIMGIFFGMRLILSDRELSDSITKDDQAYAAGMADILEKSHTFNSYDIGRGAAIMIFTSSIGINPKKGVDFDNDAIIDGARGALELAERKMSVEEAEMLHTKYYLIEAQYDVQTAEELDNNDDIDVVIVEEDAVKKGLYDFEVDGIYYNINGNEASVAKSPKSNKYSGHVTIPETVADNGITYSVTSIGIYAFAYCSGLISIEIPNSVTSISVYAFKDCSGLTSVSIGNSVTKIDEFAFQGCSGLTSIVVVSGNPTYDSRNNCNAIIETTGNKLILGCKNTTIPNSVTTIGSSAFSGCSGLTSIDIPNSVTSIGRFAFSSCGLTSIDIPNSVTSISSDAFWGCSGLTSINIPNSITEIGHGMFLGCIGLTSITIPNSVTSIGVEAFSSCSGLTSIAFPNSITTIGEMAFQNCSGLTSITIPNSVTTIGGFAFSMCSGLKDVYSYIDNPSLVSMDSEVFYLYFANYKKRTLHVPVGTLDAYKADTRWSQYFGNIVEMEP
ncbi:MAG: leucine-rich repeat domain-containing protein [Muribaculaceae bacterium]|nr:leucine-rich repeat domain-containing protein [Muribaculaceae bacterium]